MTMHADPFGALSRQITDLAKRLAVIEAAESRRAKLHIEATASAKPSLATAKTIAELVAVAADRFDIPAALIGSESRFSHIVTARDWVIYEARQQGRSYAQIGMALGKHHTSIVSAARREAARRAGNEPL